MKERFKFVAVLLALILLYAVTVKAIGSVPLKDVQAGDCIEIVTLKGDRATLLVMEVFKTKDDVILASVFIEKLSGVNMSLKAFNESGDFAQKVDAEVCQRKAQEMTQFLRESLKQQ